MGLEPTTSCVFPIQLTFFSFTVTQIPIGQGGIRTPEGVSRQIYSLLHLATLAPTRIRLPAHMNELAVGIEPTTPGLQNQSSTVELR